LLQRKAQEGVKVFVIVYRNIGAAIPIDSSYTKYSLLDLHPNVYVQRSPNQIRQQTFFWAHHEKILIVDHMIAFVGGLDLCFGRWDTPQHSLVDSKPSGFEEGSAKSDPNGFQLWPGKDYSNPRVQDFFNLDKPYEDMYDREKIPRMPWHDIHMQVVGQPARDLTRHFVQRWNYLLRQRTPSRPTPVLLPPPDFTDGELESLGIDGSCEIQILRSACSWSLGTPSRTENSIQMAYLKSIEMSEHLVYIENQFFITSTEFEGTKIENKIGDALVERIIRAAENDEDWRAIIIIPLMPGFQNAIDAQDGTSVRLIMHCQFRSISQGESSIFGRLRARGIEPEDYIQFFSLRNWGKIGKDEKLVTEQLYIHAKCMIVDDRIAIIGSANINERSMLGSRDSEVAALVRDTDTVMSRMAGEHYRVGRFPHTLRIRLMREHLGLDVDALMAEEREEAMGHAEQKDTEQWEEQVKKWQNETAAAIVRDHRNSNAPDDSYNEQRIRTDHEAIQRMEMLRSFNHDVDWEQDHNPNLKARKKGTVDPRVSNNPIHQADVRGFGPDNMVQRESERASLSMDRDPPKSPKTPDKSMRRNILRSKGKDVEAIAVQTVTPHSQVRPAGPEENTASGVAALPPFPRSQRRMDSYVLGLPQLSQLPALPATSDLDIGGPLQEHERKSTVPLPMLPPDFHCPDVAPDIFEDPLNETFYLDVWQKAAMNNTELYRQVFRCQPDNEVKSWAAYKDAIDYGERFEESQDRRARSQAGKSENGDAKPTERNTTATTEEPLANEKNITSMEAANIRLNLPEGDGHRECSEKTSVDAPTECTTRPRGSSSTSVRLNTASTTPPSGSRGSQDSHQKDKDKGGNPNHLQNGVNHSNTTKRRRRATTRSSRTVPGQLLGLDMAEKMLGMVQGHLVMWPHDWLAKEQETGNWLYNIDQLAPIEIYD